MKKLLITGFDCFDAQLLNPSWEAVRRLPDTVGEYRLCRLMLHTLYEKAAEELLRVAEDYKPDVIISVGQAGGRDAVTPERIAVNIRAARIGDNDGVILDGDRIAPEGPAAYFSTLPVEAMRDAIRAAGIPSSVSNTAGAFVCNDVMYSALHRYAGTPVRCGFIHVPYLPEQGQPNMSLDRTIAALIAAIEVL
jgi:pyroglutamyl-peptidase